MPSPLRVLWNALVPWRRRRRYYFLRVLPRLASLHRDPDHPDAPIAETVLARSCGLPLGEFIDIVAGRSCPPPLIEGVSQFLYRTPPPTWWTVYGPAWSVAVVLAIVAGSLAIRWLL